MRKRTSRNVEDSRSPKYHILFESRGSGIINRVIILKHTRHRVSAIVSFIQTDEQKYLRGSKCDANLCKETANLRVMDGNNIHLLMLICNNICRIRKSKIF